jgi:transcriptional regulator with XRE-family HTH domain
MDAAVSTACSGLSFSRMSRISSVLFSVIIYSPSGYTSNSISVFSVNHQFLIVKQISTIFLLPIKLYSGKVGKSTPIFVKIRTFLAHKKDKFYQRKGHNWMNRQNCISIENDQWRINLKELRNRTGMSDKQIADKENMSEKTVARVFSGEAKNPGVDNVRRIIHAMGGTWSEIFAESGAVIGGKDLAALQLEVDTLTEEINKLQSALKIANLELSVQKDKVTALTSENDLLRMKLEHKEEIIALHNYYIKREH